jgi:hypothetical protein
MNFDPATPSSHGSHKHSPLWSLDLDGFIVTIHGFIVTIHGLNITIQGLIVTIHGLIVTIYGLNITIYGLNITIYGPKSCPAQVSRSAAIPVVIGIAPIACGGSIIEGYTSIYGNNE